MKIKLIFAISLILILRYGVRGQIREINHIDLPGYVENDTLILKDVWVESLKSEAEQRKKIINLEHRLNKISEILRKKKKINDNTVKLIAEIERLKEENDSLRASIDLEIERNHSNLKIKIKLLNDHLVKMESQNHKLKLTKRKLVTYCIISTSIVIIKGILITAILI